MTRNRSKAPFDSDVNAIQPERLPFRRSKRMAKNPEIAIVGGGPAGAVAALELAHAGRRVLLIERRKPGIGKACGHCLSPRGVTALQQLGLDVSKARFGSIDRIRSGVVHLPGRQPHRVTLEGSKRAPGLLVDRAMLDHRLIEAARSAGADVRLGATASLHQAHGTGCSIRIVRRSTTEWIQPRLVIGADGLNSKVARFFDLAPRRSGRRGFGASFQLDADALSELSGVVHPGHVHMFVGSRGYMGIVETGSGLHCAIFMRRVGLNLKSALCLLAEEFDELVDVADAFGKQRTVRRCGVAPMPWYARRVANAHVALVGDAAGYVEPITGEGMALAIESAVALASLLGTSRNTVWNTHLAHEWQGEWQRRIGRRLRRCKVMGRLLRHRNLLNLTLSLIARSQAMTRAGVNWALQPEAAST